MQANAEKVGRGRLEDLSNENFHWEWQPIAQAQERSSYYEEESEDGDLKERPRTARLTDTSESENTYVFRGESKRREPTKRKVLKKADSEEYEDGSNDNSDRPDRDSK